MMDEYKQDNNAGNLGDLLKHLFLLQLLEKVFKNHPGGTIGYVESHAGAGRYNVREIHRKKRSKYRELVCGDADQWMTFERLNPTGNKEYHGSFLLARDLFLEKKRAFKMVLHEKDERAIRRINDHTPDLLRYVKGESFPYIVKDEMLSLQRSGLGSIICLIDPYWQDGSADKIWRDALNWDMDQCYILVFDFARAQGKNKNTGKLNFKWHCPDEMFIKKTGINNPINDGICGYGIFGNKHSRHIFL